jgi:hypothetical protein
MRCPRSAKLLCVLLEGQTRRRGPCAEQPEYPPQETEPWQRESQTLMPPCTMLTKVPHRPCTMSVAWRGGQEASMEALWGPLHTLWPHHPTTPISGGASWAMSGFESWHRAPDGVRGLHRLPSFLVIRIQQTKGERAQDVHLSSMCFRHCCS